MNHEIAMWRLKEGLTRDERIAREAARWPGPIWDSYVCEDSPGQYSSGVSSGGASSDRPYNEFVRADYEAVSDHIAEFDPRRVLRQAEKLRAAVAVLDDAVNGAGPAPDLLSVCTTIAELLAAIYEEEP